MYFKAAHTFNAEEAVELSVTKGEYLAAVDHVVQDGWIKVVAAEDDSRRGFVPLSYLKEISAAEMAKRPSAAASPRPARSPGAMGGSVSPSSQPRPPSTEQSPQRLVAAERQSPQQHPRREGSPGAGTALTPAQAAAGPVSASLLQNPDSIVDAFMKNEEYYKQLMRQRGDALVKMQLGLEDAMMEVAACKDKNAALAKKLHELDQVLERERHRWSERVEEEKAYVSRSLSSHQVIAPASAGNSLAATPVNSAQRSYARPQAQ
ncbi:SH3 domain protein-like protein [Strigomonas culicis]|nr:SH3 domain protein-like protein [Strigomonas culicis]EPY34537.1 SH3 domain protein-like protein [Strigomonas culicis]|eukprot:EPY33717.1 SH3 domain protein-like protein [Strigomonas culicis]